MARRSLALCVLLSLCSLLFFFAAASAGKKKPPARPVNINTANAEELQQVPGIGPATAQKILQMRKSYGAFKSVDDLLAIRGLGQKRLDKMRKYLTVGKLASPNKPAPVKPAAPSNLQLSPSNIEGQDLKRPSPQSGNVKLLVPAWSLTCTGSPFTSAVLIVILILSHE